MIQLPEENCINKRWRNGDSNQEQAARKGNSFLETTDAQQFVSKSQDSNSEVTRETRALKAFNRDNRSDKIHIHCSDVNSQSTVHDKYRTNTNSLDRPSLLDFNRQHSPFLEQQNFVGKNFPNDTMNIERYYKIAKDGYIIHFYNEKNLIFKEIKTLFSPYGNVLNIYNGNSRFVFVKYKTLDEIENCLKGLRNNNVIKILPQKDKINETNKTTKQDANQKTFTIRTPINSNTNCDKTSSESENRQSFDPRTSNVGNRLDKVHAFVNDDPWNLKHDSSNNVKDDKSSILVSSKKNTLPIEQENYVTDRMSDYYQIRKRSNTCSRSLITLDTDSYVESNVCDEMPNLISDTEMKQKDFDAVSDFSLLTDIKKFFIMPMQEVIVANIHANYGMHYILHLFEKYNPIAATSVKTISETDIRYCHVYFETVEDAIAVEKEFDNFVLSEKNLIVLRNLQLIREAHS